MSTSAPMLAKTPVDYPECDGLPMADNTKQFRRIVTIQGGLDAVFRGDPNVFVAGDLLWYPVEGNNVIRTAPDIFVVFGRPKGDRGSYLQWREDNIAPQVVFEVLSPGNRAGRLFNKFRFYERQHGVEEYYIYDPDGGELSGVRRIDGEFQEIPEMSGWVSPRLQMRFELVDGELRLIGPDGKKFATYVELVEQREKAQKEKKKAQKEKEKAEKRAGCLAAQLKALGVKPEE